MAKETRKVTQYKVFTIIKNYSKKKGGRDVNYRSEIALFDDTELAGEYLTKLNGEEVGKDEVITYEIVSKWVEIEPKAENFSILFNPKYQELEKKVKKGSKVAGLEKLNNK